MTADVLNELILGALIVGLFFVFMGFWIDFAVRRHIHETEMGATKPHQDAFARRDRDTASGSSAPAFKAVLMPTIAIDR